MSVPANRAREHRLRSAGRAWRPGVAALVAGAALALMQAPGKIIADTKLDLVLDPGAFLGRATRLWQSGAGFGSIQNQAAGYLFPMGPFFLAGDAAGLPGWVVQRLWIGALLGLAAWGTMRVAAGLGIGDRRSQVIAGAAYALSPSMLATVGTTSGGQLPMALAPWALLPLMWGAKGGGPRRAAAASGLAIAAMGGINAASTLAVLPLGAMFLLTRARSAQRRRLLGWWLVAVPLATLWWAGPLAVQGRYGFDFVPFTETAAVTTATTSAVEILRGTGYWLAHLHAGGEPWLPAGWLLVADPAVVLATGLLAAAGLAGLSRRDHPERQFLVLTSLLLFAVMTVGYSGAAGGPLSDPAQRLLDGSLSAFRNVHKFEPGLRLALALGLGHLLAVASIPRLLRPAGLVAAAVAVVVAATPAVTGRLPVDGSFSRVPAHWEQAARWLDQHGEGGRALVVPSAAFAEHRWGRPLDEPLQGLARSPWAVRNLVPLGSVENRALLDRIDRAISSGQPVAGLAEVLARAGVGHLVARNDLDLGRTSAPPPAVVRAALDATPGLRLAAAFGPRVPAGLSADQLLPELGQVDSAFRSVEIWEVASEVEPLSAAVDEVAVLGDAASTMSLASAGVSPASIDSAGAVVTDDVRRRSRAFGDVRGGRSHALAGGERDPLGRDAPPLEPEPSAPAAVSQVRYDDGIRLTASSAGAFGTLVPSAQPFAAFDGQLSSAWTPASPRSAGAWVEISLPKPVAIDRIDVALLRDRPTRAMAVGLRVSTDSVERDVRLEPIAGPQTVAVDSPPTRRLRITLTRVRDFGSGTGNAGITDIAVPGVTVTRRIVLPSPGPAANVTTLLRRETANRFVAGDRDEDTTFDRSFEVPPASYEITGTASLEPGGDLESVFPARAAAIAASSRWNGLATFAPHQAFDGDASTVWVADPFDSSPTLHLAWDGAREVRSVRVTKAPGPVRTPRRLLLLAGGDTRTVHLDAGGAATFAPLRTSSLTVVVAEATEPRGTPAAFATPTAAGAAEITLPDLGDLLAPAPAGPDIDLPCGRGPVLTVGGTRIDTRVSGSRLAAITHQPLTITGCQAAALGGRTDLSAHPAGGFAVDTLAVRPAGAPAISRGQGREAIVHRWDDEDRRVGVEAGPAAVLALTENANPGWQATAAGRRLAPVVVDGWRQGWQLPAGPRTDVHITFGPGRTYRAALIAGALAVLLLAAFALWPTRRAGETDTAGPGAPIPPGAAVAVAAAAVALSGGLAVLALPLLLLLPSRDRAGPVVAATSFGIATALAVAAAGASPSSGDGAFGPVAQILSLVAIATIALSLAPATRLRFGARR